MFNTREVEVKVCAISGGVCCALHSSHCSGFRYPLLSAGHAFLLSLDIFWYCLVFVAVAGWGWAELVVSFVMVRLADG